MTGEPCARVLRYGASAAGFLDSLPTPLSYPVAIDETGQIADGYDVQDQPWFVLVSRAGRILWYWDGSTQGWPTETALIQHVRAALSKPPPVSDVKLRPPR